MPRPVLFLAQAVALLAPFAAPAVAQTETASAAGWTAAQAQAQRRYDMQPWLVGAD